MKKKKDKKFRIRISSYTKGGLAATGIFLLSAIILAVAVVISFKQGGNSGVWIGLMPLLSFVISVIGFVIVIKSFEEDGKFLTYSYIGTISNAVVWLVIIAMYLAFV